MIVDPMVAEFVVAELVEASKHYAPMIHLLPGMREMSPEISAQQMKVQTAMNGIAAAVCRWSVWIETTDHRCSQKMCIRYIP